MGHKIGAVARLAGTSVRTLHHYDEIGLLRPSGRSSAGYRLYTDGDLEVLQQILFFRELGFALEDIGRIVHDEAFDREKALVSQRALLVEKRERIERMVELVEKALAAAKKGTAMSPEEMFEGLDFDPRAHAAEAKERWGKTPEFAESQRRTAKYGKADWAEIQAEMKAITDAFAEAMGKGEAANGQAAMDVAERARLHIDRRFYPCPKTMHAALGRMYVEDARFAANYERVREGLAQYVCDAIQANAAR